MPRSCQLDFIHRRVGDAAEAYARFVSHHAVSAIVIPLAVVCLLAIRLIVPNPIEVQPDYIDYYVPDSGRVTEDLRSLQKYFPIDDNQNMYALRRYEYNRMGYIIVKMKPGRSFNEPEILFALAGLWKAIIDLPLYQFHEKYTYSSICVTFPFLDDCIVSPIIGLTVKRFQELFRLNYPVHYVEGIGDIFIGNLIGGITWQPRNDSRQVIFNAEALFLPYMLKHSNETTAYLSRLWELKLSQFLASVNSSFFDVAWWTGETLQEESQSQSVPALIVTIVLIVVIALFAILASLSLSAVRSQPFAALSAILSAVAGIAAGIFIMLCANEPFSTMAKIVPVEALLVGIQHYFFMLHAWKRSEAVSSVGRERIIFMFRESMPGITAVTVVLIVGYAAASLSVIPAIRSFAKFGLLTILMVYLFQMTMLLGAMVMCGRREANGKHCFTCDIVESSSLPGDSQHTCSHKVMETIRNHTPYYTDESTGIKGRFVTRFIHGPLANFLGLRILQFAVVAGFAVIIAAAAVGCSRMKLGLQPDQVLARKSPAQRTVALADEYFGHYCDYFHVWFDGLERYPLSAELFSRLDGEIGRFENTDFSGVAENWISHLDAFARNNSKMASVLFNDQSATHDDFVELMQKFVLSPQGANFTNDFIFNANGSLVAARFVVRLANCQVSNQTRMMQSLQAIAANSSLNARVYHDFFRLADQNLAVKADFMMIVRCLIVSAVVMCILLIPFPPAFTTVALSIVANIVCTLGFMSFAGYHFELSSIISLLLAAGFFTNFPFHVAYHFAKPPSGTAPARDAAAAVAQPAEAQLSSADRIRQALDATILPLRQSAVAGFLAIACIAPMDNYVSHVVIQAVALSIFFATIQAAPVVPCVLALFYGLIGLCCGAKSSARTAK